MDVYENFAGGGEYTLWWLAASADGHMVRHANGGVSLVSDDGTADATIDPPILDAGAGTVAATRVGGDVLTLDVRVPAGRQATVHLSVSAERDLLAVGG